jgi:hypothetical protein
MKRTLIATIVAAIILFAWQFISQAALDLHKAEHQYTAKQDTILNVLASSGLKSGKYALPLADPALGAEAQMKCAADNVGKPSAIINYTTSSKNDMGMNILRGLLVNILIMYLFISLLSKTNITGFKSILSVSLTIGIIGFFNHAYTNYIWYHGTDIFMDMLDALVGWGLVGLWLGKYYKR